jgi:hypothetical protein
MRQSAEAPAALDLGDWRGHRVLAKRGSVYLPGVIRNAGGGGYVDVQFDHEPVHNVVRFHDPSTSLEVIGDYTPPSSSLSDGDRVCVKIDPNQSVFAEGYVLCTENEPGVSSRVTQYRVRIVGQDLNNEKVVRRPHLRLMRPPWWEELEDAFVVVGASRREEAVVVSEAGTSVPSSSSVSVSVVASSSATPSSAPAVVHPVYLCSSPVVPGATVGQTVAAIAGLALTRSSSGGSEDARRRFDDYDSEDELHQAGMAFVEAGKLTDAVFFSVYLLDVVYEKCLRRLVRTRAVNR